MESLFIQLPEIKKKTLMTGLWSHIYFFIFYWHVLIVASVVLYLLQKWFVQFSSQIHILLLKYIFNYFFILLKINVYSIDV